MYGNIWCGKNKASQNIHQVKERTVPPGYSPASPPQNNRSLPTVLLCWGTLNPTTLTLSANNIFDVDARRHASVLKDFAPLAGRDLRATLSFKL